MSNTDNIDELLSKNCRIAITYAVACIAAIDAHADYTAALDANAFFDACDYDRVSHSLAESRNAERKLDQARSVFVDAVGCDPRHLGVFSTREVRATLRWLATVENALGKAAVCEALC